MKEQPTAEQEKNIERQLTAPGLVQSEMFIIPPSVPNDDGIIEADGSSLVNPRRGGQPKGGRGPTGAALFLLEVDQKKPRMRHIKS